MELAEVKPFPCKFPCYWQKIGKGASRKKSEDEWVDWEKCLRREFYETNPIWSSWSLGGGILWWTIRTLIRAL